MRFFKPETLFQVNHHLNVEVVEVDDARIVLVDDFYATPDMIRKLILQTPAPIWKTSKNSKNFIEYHDCRHQTLVDDGFITAQQAIACLARKYLGIQILKPISVFNTNYFQLIHHQPEHTVPVPHEDGECLAALVCFNTPEECAGGTGFYQSKFNKSVNTAKLTSLERDALYEWMQDHNLFEEGDDYFLHNWQEYWDLAYLAEMRYNRLIMYYGPIFHGAHHCDNQFRNYPRINHMMFYEHISHSGQHHAET
ncbi:MAG: DUF6445 family protein [Pseudomonadota bacterium]